MTPILSDEDLRQALAAGAASFAVPDPGELSAQLSRDADVVPLYRRGRVQLVSLAAAAVVAALLLASVTSNSPSLNKQSSPATLRPDRAAAPTRGFAGGASEAGGGTSGGSPAFAPLPSVPTIVGGASAGVAIPSDSAAAPDSARIVQTGSISLVVDDGKVAQAIGQLKVIAARVRGYVAEEQTQAVGDNPTGTITLRIPVASFNAVVKEITSKGFGAKVVSSDSAGKDVTAEYADTATQIATLKAARARYLTILNAAKTVGEILSVQQRVDDVQGQIDRLEGARRVLANQSDLATLTVTVNQKAGTVLITEPTGWSKAWKDAGHGFTSGVESLIAHSGRALLVLIVGALLVFAGRFGWRLARRRLI